MKDEPTSAPEEKPRPSMNQVLGRAKDDNRFMATVGWVYFVASPELAKIKIGFTANKPPERISNLTGTLPLKLVPLGLLRGSSYLEFQLQQLFRPICWRGEWFFDCPVLRRFIAEEALPWSAADEVDVNNKIEAYRISSMIKKSIKRAYAWVDRNRPEIESAAAIATSPSPQRFGLDAATARKAAAFLIAYADTIDPPVPSGNQDSLDDLSDRYANPKPPIPDWAWMAPDQFDWNTHQPLRD